MTESAQYPIREVAPASPTSSAVEQYDDFDTHAVVVIASEEWSFSIRNQFKFANHEG